MPEMSRQHDLLGAPRTFTAATSECVYCLMCHLAVRNSSHSTCTATLDNEVPGMLGGAFVTHWHPGDSSYLHFERK